MNDKTADPETQALFSTFLLCLIKKATLQCERDSTDLKSVGIALRSGWITPDHACAWLADAGLIDEVIGGDPWRDCSADAGSAA